MALLDVTDLRVSYGIIEAVRGISLSVEPGEIYAVLGANGAGKSSTLRALAGLERSSGSVSLNSVEVGKWPAYRRARHGVTLVPEGRRVFAPLTVEENLMIGAYNVTSKPEVRRILSEVYAMFPRLAERQDSAAGLLSGGEQQMLAFGRAMMAAPRVILMDEPSMGLAPTIVDLVLDSARRIADTGVGVMLVEQNAVGALAVADRAGVLERGTLVIEGRADELREHPQVLRSFLGAAALPPP